jgi:hypothetical protein
MVQKKKFIIVVFDRHVPATFNLNRNGFNAKSQSIQDARCGAVNQFFKAHAPLGLRAFALQIRLMA